MRKTIYISERRHKEVAEFIRNLPSQEVSYEAVKLMEDGMKWRGMGNHENKRDMETRSSGTVLLHKVPVSTVEEKWTGC